MNRLLHTLLNLAWALWFGGLVMLFLAVSSLFQTFAADHAVAGDAASGIFHQFNGYRVGVVAVVLLLTAACWLQNRTKLAMTAFVLFALAAVAAFVSTAVLTPRIDQMRVLGNTKSMEFARLHGISMAIYLAETILVFVGGLLLPSIRIRPSRPEMRTSIKAKTRHPDFDTTTGVGLDIP